MEYNLDFRHVGKNGSFYATNHSQGLRYFGKALLFLILQTGISLLVNHEVYEVHSYKLISFPDFHWHMRHRYITEIKVCKGKEKDTQKCLLVLKSKVISSKDVARRIGFGSEQVEISAAALQLDGSMLTYSSCLYQEYPKVSSPIRKTFILQQQCKI